MVRSDKIVALEPIGRWSRTRSPYQRYTLNSFPLPIIASRTENSIVANIVRTPIEVLEATSALELLQDVLDDISKVGPMLRKSIKEGSRS